MQTGQRSRLLSCCFLDGISYFVFQTPRVLFTVFEIVFRFDQFQRLFPDFLILHNFIQIPEALQDVIPDQGAILFSDALREADGELIHQHLLLLLPRRANFPNGLHRMPCGDETLILRHGQKGREIFLHPIFGIAFGEIAQHLRRDGTDVVVLVTQVFNKIVPGFAGRIHGMVGDFENVGKGAVL